MIHITFLIQIFVWTLATHTETEIKYKKSGVTLTEILKVKFDNVPKVSYFYLRIRRNQACSVYNA